MPSAGAIVPPKAVRAALHDAAPAESQHRDPLPKTLFNLVRRTSSWHQLWLVILSIIVFALSTAPLEVQRRLVNDAVRGGNYQAILILAAIYAGLALSEGLVKLGMNIYRSWVSEGAVRWLRTAIFAFVEERPGDHGAESDGIETSMIIAEADPIGSFVGMSLSEPVLQGGVLLSVFGYMVYLQPLMALVALTVFFPQFIFVPLMQQAINRRVASRTLMLREISVAIADEKEPSPEGREEQVRRISQVFVLNMGMFKLKFSMNFLMNLLYHMGVAAILGLGGYYVVNGQTEIGTVVAFASGLAKVNDPWDDIVNWFRDYRVTQTKYDLIYRASRVFQGGTTTKQAASM